MFRFGRQIAFATGVVLVALAGGAEVLRIGASPGFGPIQWLLLVAGVGVLPLSALSGPWARRYGRLSALLLFSYLGCLLFEIGLNLAIGAARNTGASSLRGYVEPAQWGGYQLTRNWHGFYDDGPTRVAVDINSRGDRDDEPERQPPTARLRVLLLGDSQTFGIGLRKEETIESRIESLSRGEVAAYNLGVPGYGPGDSLEHYRERTELATHAFFLLYGNDLRYENCRTAFHTAIDGFIVPRARLDGSRLSPEELRQAISEAEPSHGWALRIKGAVLLEQLRRRLDVLLDPEQTLLIGAPSGYSEECSRAAAHQADAMRTLARERGQAFAVVVVPTVGEAVLQRYSRPMQVCRAELERLSIPMLEVRELLSRGDYLPRDEHLAASGVDKVARAILRAARRGDRPYGMAAAARRDGG